MSNDKEPGTKSGAMGYGNSPYGARWGRKAKAPDFVQRESGDAFSTGVLVHRNGNMIRRTYIAGIGNKWIGVKP